MAFNGRGGVGMSAAAAAGEHSHKTLSAASFGSGTTTSPHSRLQHPKPISPQKPNTFVLSPSSTIEKPAERNANLDFSQAQSFARKELLGGSFGDLSGAQREPEETPEDMQKKDPLATQVWRLYSKQKNVLPNAERMENLTWRMMSMTLRKEQQQAR
ncbi:Sodium- and chloride-dependent GABA transporter 1 [Maublancomyces gigas]|uniref:Sodium- and chloride-dependent GABA transporter 1 n=1 Tax=Discina gigas TaxID=1032678 RepID=A0ABR3G887_9PEZI